MVRTTLASFARIALGLVVAGAGFAGCGDSYDPCDPPAYLKGSVTEPAYCVENDAPSQPMMGLATPYQSGTVELSWTVSYPVAESYLVERSVNGGMYAPLRQLSGSLTTFADTDLKPETRYSYRVTASRVNAMGKTVSSTSPVRETTTPSAAVLGGDTIPTGTGKQLAVRAVKNKDGTTTVYACLPRENNRTGSTNMTGGDAINYTALDPSKKPTELAIDCTWAVAPTSRIVWVVSDLPATSSADLSANTKTDGTGVTTTLVTDALGNRPYRIFDLSFKLVRTQSGVSFAQLTYDNGAFGVDRPLVKGVSGVTPIEGSGVLK